MAQPISSILARALSLIPLAFVSMPAPALLTSGVALVALSGCAALTGTGGMPERTVEIPDNARVGVLQLGVFPKAVLNRASITLGPGTRIIAPDNSLILPSSLSGEHHVAYQTGPSGEVIRVWLLTRSEYLRMSAFQQNRTQ